MIDLTESQRWAKEYLGALVHEGDTESLFQNGLLVFREDWWGDEPQHGVDVMMSGFSEAERRYYAQRIYVGRVGYLKILAVARKIVQRCVAQENWNAWLSLEDAAQVLDIDLRTLKRMVSEAPGDLPGAPVPAGVGKKRKLYRWAREDLARWMRAYGLWRESQDDERKQARMKRKKKAPSARGRARRDSPAKDDLRSFARRLATA
ncbi:MAG: helix-turn-helix domain-containing protein [Pseudomonadota bacterium]